MANFMCYYPSWNRHFRSDKIDFSRFTHVFHAFVRQKPDGSLVVPKDFREPSLTDRAGAAGCAPILSLGGGAGWSAGFGELAALRPSRRKYIDQVVEFCLKHGYVGIDLDWEFPANARDRDNMTLLVREFRRKFGSDPRTRKFLITMAICGFDWNNRWMDFEAINPHMDFYNLMFYDSHGIWHDHAGHNAPLYRAGDICSRNCADMLAYLERGKRIPRGKMNMGVPFYGFRYDRIRRFYEQGQDCGGEYLTYSQVERTAARGWTRRFDKKCRVPYLVKNGGRGIITYDDPGSIREKVRFARENRLAGVFMWEVSQDYDKGRTPLLDAMREEFRKSFGA